MPLKINHNLINPQTAQQLVEICPFSAIGYQDGKLDINSACRMCKICVRKGPKGAIEFVPEAAPTGVDKSAWRGIAVYADHEDGHIHPVTFELIGKARQLAQVTGHPVLAVLIGHGLSQQAQTLLRYGVDQVHVYDDPALQHFLIDPYTNVLEDFINEIKPSSVLVGATSLGRSLAPRIAARFRTGLTADCTALEMKSDTDLVQIRPAFGGNIMAQIVTPNSRPQFCTVRYKVFSAPAQTDTPGGEVIVHPVAGERVKTDTTLLSVTPKPQQSDISEAEILVAVGRGIKNKADLDLAKQLADALGARMACTRPLVENGWFDAKSQIGLSGRTVKPRLIVTLGIHGAVQFTAGMRSADCIIAVDQDAQAPIFDVAHYGVVGDIYEVIPALIARIKEGEGYVA